MAQEIVTWCDVHMKREERVPGSTVTVTIDSTGPIQIDVCSMCHEEVVSPLLALLEDGRPVKDGKVAKPAAKSEHGPLSPAQEVTPHGNTRYACPECEKEGVMFRATRSSFRDHFATVHKTTLAEYESKVLGRTLDGLPLLYECTEEGCGLKFSHPQGVGAHRKHVHGIEGESRSSKYDRAKEQEALAGV